MIKKRQTARKMTAIRYTLAIFGDMINAAVMAITILKGARKHMRSPI